VQSKIAARSCHMVDIQHDYDVIIAGYGPTGAVAAACLGAAGVRTLVVEPQADIYPLPRAVHFDDEIMQIFQRLGINDAVLEHATPSTGYEFRAADGQVLLRFSEGAIDTPSGWKSGYLFHQPGIERAIRAKAQSHASVTILLGASVTNVRQDADHVICMIDNARPVSARFLIAADGANSPIRTQLGLGIDDYGFDEPWLVVDALVRDAARLPTINLQICDPARPTTCVYIGKGRHRWEFMLLPGETPAIAGDDAFIAALFAPWDCEGAITVERRAVYRFHAKVAQRWKDGAVLLAGDAAHQMPPFAGQGMCSGIRDAVNIAWKIDAIINSGADVALLETYQIEREANVRAYVELAIGMGQVVCTLDPDVAAARDAHMLAERAAGVEPLRPPAMPPICGAVLEDAPTAGERFYQPWTPRNGLHVGLEDVLGRAAWLITRTATDAPIPGDVAAACIGNPVLNGFDDSLSDWLDTNGVEAVLVRPDRYIFGGGTAANLLNGWRAITAAQKESLPV
jgi:3-(3-hydroxy-phenyl)propionate hydroxylase